MSDSVPFGQQTFPLAIDDTVIAAAWDRSDGRCECRSLAHGHDLRCNRSLVWPNRNQALGRGAWMLRFHRNGAGDGPHIEIVCAECAAREAAAGA